MTSTATLAVGTRVNGTLARTGTIRLTGSPMSCVDWDQDPGHPTWVKNSDLVAMPTLTGKDARRQAKIARMINTLDAQRARAGESWEDMHALARQLDPDGLRAWWNLVAAQAGVNPPGEDGETIHLAMVQLATLARWHDDPFAGIPKAARR